ncbi:MAG: neutral/alkaline non-lysosomal ceramidase N-terminal domain-containing protein [Bacteroidales bacterium]|nr:neutral/alkaline non-lysosomal ceramidase N-terminal domain-containing protein [Bacteroidales bacterium]
MKKTLILSIAMLLSAGAFAQEFKAGAAKVDITPRQDQVVNKTDIIRDKIQVKAVYMTDGTTPAVIVTVDGDARTLGDALQRASAQTGCPEANFWVCGTHSHSAQTNGIGPGGFPSYEQVQNAVIEAAVKAKANMVPVRVGYAKTQVDLNVNRDNYNDQLAWSQSANWTAPCDKDLTVLAFLDKEDIPVAILMNYAMHPVNFFMSGVVSSDFPGDATTYIENLFGGNTVALFTQGASGDVNPKMAYTHMFQKGQVKGVLPGPKAKGNLDTSKNPTFKSEEVAADELADHKEMIRRKDEYVKMLGWTLGNNAVMAMHYNMAFETAPEIWTGETIITCPGRERIDKEGRENYDPGYKPAGDVQIGVGLLRIGDIAVATVSGEVYTEIGQRLKKESPAAKTMFVTLADGPYESGYIYSNKASHHLTFQVIGSNLQPGYAENGILEAFHKLYDESKK